ncbi:hydroxyphenylacetyl-CoA thioesterase PaaI [Halorussus lipolyticus]|uniref:hydroxyphenylacetyl-CoA thioesterase PaaI n=1 Tax=Halorussus lipolyticus TaxID=3034024 RepID=UPI0023E8341A|nr:hydroxyphenylacetyl-CoA thioesterase PaaI [Halorussus sp. DT80]
MTEIPDDRRETIESDPFCEQLGVELDGLGPGAATTELTVTDDLLNFHGTPHGGAIYSLADAAFAAASNAEGDTALALETNISYFEAVSVGETLTAEAERVHQRGRTASYRVTVTDERGDEIAAFRGRVYLPGD